MNEKEEKHKEYKFTIDSKPFETPEHLITGEEIRKKGNIPTDYDIFLKRPGHKEDELIKDDQKVELSHHEVKHFYGCKRGTRNG